VSYAVGAAANVASLSAYGGYVLCAYEAYETNKHCRFVMSDDDGDTWNWDYIGDSSISNESPAVCAREGGGIGVAYRYYTDPRQGRYMWRQYDGSFHDIPQVYADHEPYYNQPDIVFMGGGRYGTLYLCWNDPYVRAAYFDRGSCCENRGDVNHDGTEVPDIADLVFLVTYMFQEGPPPLCDEPYSPECPEHFFAETDVNGDGTCVPDIADLVYMVTFMFQDGPDLAPCP